MGERKGARADEDNQALEQSMIELLGGKLRGRAQNAGRDHSHLRHPLSIAPSLGAPTVLLRSLGVGQASAVFSVNDEPFSSSHFNLRRVHQAARRTLLFFCPPALAVGR